MTPIKGKSDAFDQLRCFPGSSPQLSQLCAPVDRNSKHFPSVGRRRLINAIRRHLINLGSARPGSARTDVFRSWVNLAGSDTCAEMKCLPLGFRCYPAIRWSGFPRHLVWHQLCKCSRCTTAGFAGCRGLLTATRWQCFRILTRSHESGHWRMLSFPSYNEFDWISSQTRVCTAKCAHIKAWLLWGLFDLIIILATLPRPRCVHAVSYYFFTFQNYPHWSGCISITERNTTKSESSELFM